MDITFQTLDSPTDMVAIEELQLAVWSGGEISVVPAHLLIAAVRNGGVLIGAYLNQDSAEDGKIIGFVFGFPGFYDTPDGPRLLHVSHMLGVLPFARDQGVGFMLKRAQWQLVRKQGIDRIIWTFDPLQSRNAYLNISKLGAVSNTYYPDYYGELRDELNAGMATDRFQVDWWVNTRRVERRLSSQVRRKLDFAHYTASGAQIVNRASIEPDGLVTPSVDNLLDVQVGDVKILLVEIPAQFPELSAQAPELATDWRIHTRKIFSDLFAAGFLVTDFVHLAGSQPRSFYVLSYGDSTL